MQNNEKENTKSRNQPKTNKFTDFFNKLFEQVRLFSENLKKDKQLLLITCCVLALLVTGIVIIVLSGSKADDNLRALGETPGNSSGENDADAVVVAEVLPQQRRSDGTMEDGTWVPVNQYFDPFAEPIKLTGIAIGGAGGPMAIIESGGSSFIVKVGDYVDDLWAVLDIKRGTVTLRAYNQEISLFLDQPPLTRTLDVDLDDDGQEGS
jgi:hypothetical protein